MDLSEKRNQTFFKNLIITKRITNDIPDPFSGPFNMNMEVPFIDLKARFIEEKDELLSAVNKVLSQGSLVLTNELKEFEEDVQQYTKAKHCIGLNSGTDALMMGLWASGIKKGDEVIQPAISFIATVGATVHVANHFL